MHVISHVARSRQLTLEPAPTSIVQLAAVQRTLLSSPAKRVHVVPSTHSRLQSLPHAEAHVESSRQRKEHASPHVKPHRERELH